MEDKNFSIPKNSGSEQQNKNEDVKQKQENKITQEESEYMRKVFFEEDEEVRLRDGKTYKIPPLSLKDAMKLMEKINGIDTGIIIANLISDSEGNNNYDRLLEVLHMAFKPYYPEITKEYIEEYVDLDTAKQIIDIMIGLNGLKKSL